MHHDRLVEAQRSLPDLIDNRDSEALLGWVARTYALVKHLAPDQAETYASVIGDLVKTCRDGSHEALAERGRAAFGVLGRVTGNTAAWPETSTPRPAGANERSTAPEGTGRGSDVAEASQRAVVVTALPVEHEAVRRLLEDVSRDQHPHGTIYHVGRHGRWSVALVQTGAGQTAAAVETERALEHFEPSFVAFVGVAGGVKDVGIGDVVVAEKVFGYERGKESPDFLPRPDVATSTYRAIQHARAVSSLMNREHTDFRTLVGPIAAGEKVVASNASATAKLLRSNYGDTLAVEMEGRGFLAATSTRAGIEALIIRGISDLLDGKTDADAGGSQELASRNAARVLAAILEDLGAAPPPATGSKTSIEPPASAARGPGDAVRLTIPTRQHAVSGLAWFKNVHPHRDDLRVHVRGKITCVAAEDVVEVGDAEFNDDANPHLVDWRNRGWFIRVAAPPWSRPGHRTYVYRNQTVPRLFVRRDGAHPRVLTWGDQIELSAADLELAENVYLRRLVVERLVPPVDDEPQADPMFGPAVNLGLRATVVLDDDDDPIQGEAFRRRLVAQGRRAAVLTGSELRRYESRLLEILRALSDPNGISAGTLQELEAYLQLEIAPVEAGNLLTELIRAGEVADVKPGVQGMFAVRLTPDAGRSR